MRQADTPADEPRSGRPGAFLDRDGTIIEERAYLADPADVVLLAGAADGMRRLAAAGVARVVGSHKSGNARRHLTEGDL
jgi:D-glycero-D-manno-heptose 1,7-bisphosphate phosphatase